MNTCFSFREEMGAYLYETPPPEWEAHCVNCSECRQKFQQFQIFHEQISMFDLPVAPDLIQEVKQGLLQELSWRTSISFRRFPRFSWMAATLFFIFGFWFGVHHSTKVSNLSDTSLGYPSVSEQVAPLLKNKFSSQNWLSQEGLHFLKYGKNKMPE